MGERLAEKLMKRRTLSIHQVLRMTLESMITHGEAIPDETPLSSSDTIAVTL